ncbi:MAG: hypothetical protein ACRDNJ_16705, partial [Solirubrobacteraceae bacterium]
MPASAVMCRAPPMHVPPPIKRRIPTAALAVCAVAVTLPATACAARHRATRVCHGTAAHPGVLRGTVRRNVLVRGTCNVDHGSATVRGSLTVAPRAVLNAGFGRDDRHHTGVSDLTVTGSLIVLRGATAVVGCEASAFPCQDDNQK